ncbi:MAG: YbaB/EbfC family nucleoid-associated protein [Candidatus Kapabacteria bacterium]|nr:YbaB/EbfC family nucleoid-associated protein [Ignavibacteriota bacterium]MCW5886076.1 YbaB/EbfC family nucleoid-associated protein [Candidatus Kapabacteria bacterium]
MKFDIQNVMQQAKKMQEEVENIKRELANKTVSAESGGGFVTATMTGANKLVSIKIAPELLVQNDVAMMEDLIVAAVNKAIDKAGDLANQDMNRVKNMIPSIPGLNLG